MVKIIGAGFGRTGTTSLQEALGILGFPCYHMRTAFARNHADLWMEADADPDNFDWERLFAGHEAAVDFPASMYYKQIMKAYGPDTRVLLTVRDPEKWWESCMGSIFLISYNRSVTAKLFLSRFVRMTRRICWDKLFDGTRFADKDETIRRFNAWVEEVKATVPPECLLVYQVQSGWEPLCRWLGKDVPDEPFPKINDRKTVTTFIRRIYMMDVLLYLVLSIAILVATNLLGGILFPNSTVSVRAAVGAAFATLGIVLLYNWASTRDS